MRKWRDLVSLGSCGLQKQALSQTGIVDMIHTNVEPGKAWNPMKNEMHTRHRQQAHATLWTLVVYTIYVHSIHQPSLGPTRNVTTLLMPGRLPVGTRASPACPARQLQTPALPCCSCHVQMPQRQPKAVPNQYRESNSKLWPKLYKSCLLRPRPLSQYCLRI